MGLVDLVPTYVGWQVVFTSNGKVADAPHHRDLLPLSTIVAATLRLQNFEPRWAPREEGRFRVLCDPPWWLVTVTVQAARDHHGSESSAAALRLA